MKIAKFEMMFPAMLDGERPETFPPIPPGTRMVRAKVFPGNVWVPLVKWEKGEWRDVPNLFAPVQNDRYAEGQVWVDIQGEVYIWTLSGAFVHRPGCATDPTKPGGGYPMVSWYCAKQRRRTTARLHVLIAMAWAGHTPGHGRIVRHLDDVRTNNDPTNLALGTYAQNAADALRNGKRPKGWTDKDTVQQVRDTYTGKSGQVAAMAKRFGLHRRTISDILAGRSHADVTGGKRHPLARRIRRPANV